MQKFLKLLPFIYFTALSIVISISDIKTKTVNRALSLSLLFGTIALRCLPLFLYDFRPYPFLDIFIATATGFLIFWLARLITKKQLGLADVFYAASMGAALGIKHFFIAATIGCIFALLFFVGLFYYYNKYITTNIDTTDKSKLTSKEFIKKFALPFLPFLAAAATLVQLIIDT